MNASPDNESRIGHAIEIVTGEFAKSWQADQSFRVEDITGKIPELVKSTGVDGDDPAVERRILSELILVEVSLRSNNGEQTVDLDDYRSRFQDDNGLVEEVWKWLRHNQRTVGSSANLPGSREKEIDEQESDFPPCLGPYENITYLASGGFGTVCHAIDGRDGTVVALKFPRQGRADALPMLIKEAKRAMRLHHPAIVRTRDIVRCDGYVAVVQDFIDGASLREWMKESRDPNEVVDLVATLADALAYAHAGENGIYHLDLKPDNILMDRKGNPYIADFGLALTEDEQLRAARIRCGSTYYMSPEQVQALTVHYDGRTDIWSLGVIFYELLTKRRPFRGPPGCNCQFIFELIENNDPKPPCQVDNAIDQELQRICLKCLNRRQSERYSSADLLARDLRLWQTDPPRPLQGSSDFIPQGLRSFDASHSVFFLELLPGPRDRNGIPNSILFWKKRICEPVESENRIPLGIIYGPSGSGKSSFVKAGLVPELDHTKVRTIYIEATASDTEARLLKKLKDPDHFPTIPESLSLSESLRGLSQGLWGKRESEKLLIVFDQFEQYLTKTEDFNQSELAKALRFCDGHQLQCLLLAREDFWMGLTRFCDALDIDLREGVNSQAMDLFDKKHARKILIKLGQAHGNLPSDFPETRPELDECTTEDKFLDNVIEQMAMNNQVICVRLVLFVEMFKHRMNWTPAELESAGGVTGSGEEFLEATFGRDASQQRFRAIAGPAKRLLGSLLPETGLNIRGVIKSEEELISAANLKSHPRKFKQVTSLLDSELRLITQTDPSISGAHNEKNPDTSELKHYQLTHDSLVDSIRNWIRRGKMGTVEGRTELMVKERTSEWLRDLHSRRLLGPAELAKVYAFKRKLKLNDAENRFVNASAKWTGKNLGALAAAVALILLMAVLLAGQNKYELASEKVQSLLSAVTSDEFLSKADDLRDFGLPSRELLLSEIRKPDVKPLELARLRLVLFHIGEEGWLDAIYEDLKRTPVREFPSYLSILKPAKSEISRELWKEVHGLDGNDARFRVLACLANFDPKSTNWQALTGGVFFEYLWSLDYPTMKEWFEVIAPAHDKLAKEAHAAFDRANASSQQFTYGQCVNGHADQYFDLQAFAAILLHKLGDRRRLVDAFTNRRDPTVRTFIIYSPKSRLIDDHEILSELAKIGAPTAVKSGFLHLASGRDDRDQDEEFLNEVCALLKSSRNAEIQAMLQWIIEMKLDSMLRPADRSQPGLKPQEVFTAFEDKFGHTFVVLPFRFDDSMLAEGVLPGEGIKSDRLIAVCTVEETREHLNQWPPVESATESNLPAVLSREQVMRYCNFLSEEAGFDPCYKETEDGKMVCADRFLLKGGYRLPVQAEWTFACAGGSTSFNFLGRSGKYLRNCAWYRANTRGEWKTVRQCAPNPFGLFDTLGNRWEWCHVTDLAGRAGLKMYGGSIFSNADLMHTKQSRAFLDELPAEFESGFRIVRTIQNDLGSVSQMASKRATYKELETR